MVTTRFVLEPEQIVAVPLNTDAVDVGFTVTVGVPLKPVPAQPLASTTLTKLYEVVVAGLTGILFPLV